MTGGIHVFYSLQEALALGYEVYEQTEYGYLVRLKIGEAWGFAIVDLRTGRDGGRPRP